MPNNITRVFEWIIALRRNSEFKRVCLANLGAILTIQALHTSIGIQFEIGGSEINSRSALTWWVVQLMSTAIWVSSSTLIWWAFGTIPYLRRVPTVISGVLCFWIFWLLSNGQFLFDPTFMPLRGELISRAPWIDIVSAFTFRFTLPLIIWLVFVGRVLYSDWRRNWQSRITRSNERTALVSLIAVAFVGLFMTTTRVPISTDLVAKKWQSVIIEPALLPNNSHSTVLFDDKNFQTPYTPDIDVFNIGSSSVGKSGRLSNEWHVTNATPLLEFLERNGASVELIETKMPTKDGSVTARIVQRIPASQLLLRYKRILEAGSWCGVQVDQGFELKPEFSNSSAAIDGANETYVSVSPFRAPGLYAAPIGNRVQGFGEGFAMTGHTWIVLAQPATNLDWPFDGEAGQVTSFWSSGPIRIFMEKSKLELGLGAWCGESLLKNPRSGFLKSRAERLIRITAELTKSGWFDLPASTTITRASKFWPQPISGSASTFRSNNIDGYVVINGETQPLQSGTSVRITNLTGMDADGDRARLHGRSSDMALGGFMMSKRLIVYLSWEYWSAIAALILCYFGWREHVRRRSEKPAPTL